MSRCLGDNGTFSLQLLRNYEMSEVESWHSSVQFGGGDNACIFMLMFDLFVEVKNNAACMPGCMTDWQEQ